MQLPRPQLEPIDEKPYGDQRQCDICARCFYESETSFCKLYDVEGIADPLVACTRCYLNEIESQGFQEAV